MTIQAQLADGRILEFPDGTDPAIIQSTVQRLVAASNPPKEGIMAALTGGVKRFGSTLETGLESIIDPTLAAQRGTARQEAISQQYAPGASLEKVKRAYEEKGLFPAAYEAVSQVPSALAEQFPNIASSIGGARVGAMAGSPFGPAGAIAGGIGGAFAPSLMQLYGSNLERQAQEKAPEISRSAALGAAVPGAAAEVASTFIPLGRNLIGKLLGPEAEKALARGTTQSIEAAAKETVAASLAKGAGIGALAEIPTEVTQQMLERYQAGLPLTTSDALAEYGESAYGAAIVGAPFGAVARGAGRPAAREEYTKQLQLEQIKAEQQRQKEAEAAFKRAQEERAKTEEELGVPKTLALPAPAKVYEEPKNPLIDPVGRVTEDELGKAIGNNTVVNYLNRYRKDNNLPKLKSYSIEDIKDAMTAQNPEGEEGALNAILAYKTNYQNQSYTPDDIQNIAVAKNVATDTKGFSDFLTRATGKADLNTMTQPELHSVATALDALPRTGKEEQLVLPEGSNATRFTQDQYNTGLTTALGTIKPGKPVSLEQATKAVQAQTGLETDRDAQHLLRTAAINDDLTIERGTGYQAVSPTGAVLGTYGTEAEAKRMHRRAEIKPVETELVTPRIEEAVRPEATLPEGYQIQKETTVGSEAPAAYVIREDGSQKNASQTFADEAAAKERLNMLERKREANAKAEEAAADRVRQDLEKRQAAIAQMEADGKTGTPEHTKAVYAFQAANVAGSQKITDHLDAAEALRTPLKIVPLGKKSTKAEKHTVIKDGKVVASFDTNDKAQAHVLSLLDDKALESIAERGGVMGERAKLELDMRQRPGVRGGTTEGLEKAGVRTPEMEAKLKELEKKLKPMLDKFGLGDVALNVVRAIEQNAEGSYIDKLIKIAFDAKNPIRTMRHEAIHALKELGFFTPQQWKALERQAKDVWIDKYLKGVPYSEEMSRFDAYKSLGLSDADIIEEAIADAFADFESAGKAPVGMLDALFKRMKEFFRALRQALTGAGFESAEEIFGKIERGELVPRGEPVETIGERLSLLREAYPDETEISTQNPQGVKRIYDPITQMLSIDEAAVREAMKANPDMARRTIQAIKAYGFIPKDTKNKDVLEVFKRNIVNNLIFLYRSVPERIRQRSKLWYDGANKIATEMATEFGTSMEQVAGIMAAMSPQKDWFQNVSMAERALDILTKHGNRAWDENMLKYANSYVKEAKDRKEREKRQDAFDKIKAVAAKGTKLKDMDIKEAAAFIRAYDEAYHSRNYRIVTPEGGFGDLVRNLDGKPSTMMWSTYGPIEKTVSIFRDGSRKNISQQLGFEHKIRSFYNNISAPNSDISHVTIDTHAVAAGLFEALAGTDPEVAQNFGATGSSDVIGVGGTYGLIADAYREAAEKMGIKAREMQSITWEAVRGLFTEEMKSSIKPKIRAEWAKYKNGEQTFDETRTKVIEIAGGFKDPDWVGSGVGSFVENGGTSYDKSFVPEGGVRLREAQELRERLTFNLSAVTNSIPGLRELYQRAMGKDKEAYAVLQRVAESSLSYLLSGTNARVNVEYAKGVYLSDREPSISVQVSFEESESPQVLAALAKFAESYNQQQIHVRQPTIRKPGYEFADGSYATVVYQIPLKKELSNVRISEIIEQSGLAGFTVTPDTLTAYWVKGDDNAESSFDSFEKQVTDVYGLVGAKDSKTRRTTERLYVYGDGYGAQIPYSQITGDVRPKQSSDTVTPRIIAEYLTGEPVTAFKQKPLTQPQVKEQELLADVFDELPLNDLKRPLVKKAYQALAKALKEQFAVLPIKVELVDSTAEPYANSAEMREDVSKNNRFRVYKTTPETFGPPGSNFRGHPLLQDSGLTDINGEPMLYNDLLRAVHDYFAHNLSETEFGPRGETAAWRNHMATTNDPLARWALTVETRAQNAWQNFRRGVQDLTLMQRGFADQKASLPPVNFVLTGDAKIDAPMIDYIGTLDSQEKLGSLSPDSALAKKVMAKMPEEKLSLRTYFPTAEEAEQAAYKKAPPTTPEFKRFFGASKVKEEGRPQVMYHASPNIIDQFRENKPIFVSPSPTEAEYYGKRHRTPENMDVNIYPLWVRAETPFDYENKNHLARLSMYFGDDEVLMDEIADGNWDAIESPEVQDAIIGLGHDSFYVNEGKEKNLAVFNANQVKSVTGNIGEFGENKDIRFSLKRFDREDLPKNDKPFTLPENTMLFHGSHETRAKEIEAAGRVLVPSYPIKTSGGTLDEGGLIFFGDKDIAQKYANSEADPLSVQAAIERGEVRNPGVVFETVTDRPYRLMSRYHKLTKAEAQKLNRDLGIPDYKRLQGGDSANIAAGRAFTNSDVVPRYKTNKGEMASVWPAIFRSLGFDGFYDNHNAPAVAMTADNGIKLIGDDGRMVKYSLPTFSAAAVARRDATTTRRESKGVIERVLESFAPERMADLRAAFIHRYNQLGVYDRMLAEKMGGKVLLADVSAEAAANMSDLSASVTASAFGIGNRKGGIPVYKNGVTTIDTSVKGPLEILSPLAQFNDPVAYQDYQYWAGVKRGSRFMADGREKNFEAQDVALAEEIRKAYLQKGVNFNAIQTEMNKFNDGLVNYMVATGVLSKDRGEAFKKHMDYIPFFRQIDGDNTVGPKIFNSISGVKPPKKLKGSEAPLTDYLESIVRNTQAAINAGMKNIAAQKAINVAMQLGPKVGAQRLNTIDNGPDTVQVLENGKQVSYRVADQLFINAVKSLNIAEMPFLGFLSAPSNLLRNLVTKDPGFMLANLARDSLSAWVVGGSNATPLIGTASNFVKALGNQSPTLHALLNAGILGGYEFSSGVLKSGEVLERDLAKKYGAKGAAAPLGVFTGIWDALEKGTEASDAATRMAVYDRVLAETGNEAEALYRALEVMNFNRKGSSPVVRILTAAIPFLNARIQGLDVFYRTAMGRNVSANAEAMQKAFFVRGATLMALSAAYFLAVSDDDEWKKQEQETKDNYWIAPGIGKFPTPFEVGFLFKTMPERIMAYTLKDDTGQDLMDSMKRGLLNTFAFNPIPQVAKPFIEYAANYNFFTGRPIVGMGMEGKEPEYQVGPNTTHSMEWLGKQLGMSPLKLEQVYGGFTGTMGMYALTAFDAILNTQSDNPHASKRFEQLPIVKRFAADPEARGNITQYYELKKAVDAAVETQNYLLKAGKPEEFAEFMEKNAGLLATKQYVANIEKTMKQMREMRKTVQGAEMTADEKRDTLIAIGQAENNLTQNIQTVKKMISEF